MRASAVVLFFQLRLSVWYSAVDLVSPIGRAPLFAFIRRGLVGSLPQVVDPKALADLDYSSSNGFNGDDFFRLLDTMSGLVFYYFPVPIKAVCLIKIHGSMCSEGY